MPKPNHPPYPNSSEPIFKADCSPTAYGQSQMMLTSINSGNKRDSFTLYRNICSFSLSYSRANVTCSNHCNLEHLGYC